eukprot:2874370-Pyramimonas_sp.AAC.1
MKLSNEAVTSEPCGVAVLLPSGASLSSALLPLPPVVCSQGTLATHQRPTGVESTAPRVERAVVSSVLVVRLWDGVGSGKSQGQPLTSMQGSARTYAVRKELAGELNFRATRRLNKVVT